MFTQRHTAHKLMIKDITSNEYVRREGESDYVVINGQQVSRVRLIATIVNKYVNDERKSGTIVLDDGSDVISTRAWENEFHLIDKTAIGQLVEVFGRVRQYNDEVYLTPEIIKPINPDWFVLRKIELSQDQKVSTAMPEEKKELPKQEVKTKPIPEVKPVKANATLKDSVLKLIQEKGSDGVLMDEVVGLVSDKTEAKAILRELLEEDMIFEPRAGRYKSL